MQLLRNLLAILLCSTSLLASETKSLQALDQAASEAYRAQKYELAEEHWSQALELDEVQLSSTERARILYNLGNVALRSGNELEAVALYRSSLKLRPRNDDALANLDFARTEAELTPAASVSFLGSLTLAETEQLVLFLALALFLMLLGEAALGGAFRPAALIAALLLLGSLIPWASRIGAADRVEAMVVKRAGTSLRSEPRLGSTALTRLDPGTEHIVRDELPDWFAVETSDGIEGWVKASDLIRTTR